MTAAPMTLKPITGSMDVWRQQPNQSDGCNVPKHNIRSRQRLARKFELEPRV